MQAQRAWWDDAVRNAEALAAAQAVLRGDAAGSTSKMERVQRGVKRSTSSLPDEEEEAPQKCVVKRRTLVAPQRLKHVNDVIKSIQLQTSATTETPPYSAGCLHPVVAQWASWLDAVYVETAAGAADVAPFLELVPREWEEAHLRPPLGGTAEEECVEHARCEAYQIVAQRVLLDTPEDATPTALVRFKTPRGQTFDGLCLMCLRRRTTVEWMDSWAREKPVVRVRQPYRVGDEYCQECFIPRAVPGSTAFYGISDAFVRHRRVCYKWVANGRFQQRIDENFRRASSVDGRGLDGVFGVTSVRRWRFDDVARADARLSATRDVDVQDPGLKRLIAVFGRARVLAAIAAEERERSFPLRVDVAHALFAPQKRLTRAEAMLRDAAPHKLVVKRRRVQWEGDADAEELVAQSGGDVPLAMRRHLMRLARLDGCVDEVMRRIYGGIALDAYEANVVAAAAAAAERAAPPKRLRTPRAWFWVELARATHALWKSLPPLVPLFDARWAYGPVANAAKAAEAAGYSAACRKALVSLSKCETNEAMRVALRSLAAPTKSEVAAVALVVTDGVALRTVAMPSHWPRTANASPMRHLVCPSCQKFKGYVVESYDGWKLKRQARRDETKKQRMGSTLESSVRDMRKKRNTVGPTSVSYDASHDQFFCFPKKKGCARLDVDDDFDDDAFLEEEEEEGGDARSVRSVRTTATSFKSAATSNRARKTAMSYAACAETPCVVVDLDGTTLDCWGRQIVACWRCASPCVVDDTGNCGAQMLCTVCLFDDRERKADRRTPAEGCVVCGATSKRSAKTGVLHYTKAVGADGVFQVVLCSKHAPPIVTKIKIWYWDKLQEVIADHARTASRER